MRQTRRAMLARCGLAVTAATGIAGCLGGDRLDRDEPGGGEAFEGRYLASPEAIGLDHYAFKSTRTAALMEHEDALSESVRSDLQTDVDVGGFGTYGELDALHQLANAIKILEGDHDVASTVEHLESEDFVEAESHQGYRLFDATGPVTAAVGDELLLIADAQQRDLNPAPDVARAVLDAAAGDGDRYQDVNEDFGRLVEAVGGGDVVLGRTTGGGNGTFDGASAEGARWAVGESSAEATVATVFENESAADPEAVEFWVTTVSPFVDVNPEVNVDGRVVTAAGERATGGVESFNMHWTTRWHATPGASFGFDYDPDAETVEVQLDSTENPVYPENLYVRGRGFAERAAADQTEAGRWQGTASGPDGEVEAGDSVVVGVTPDYELAVVWEGEVGALALNFGAGPEA